jgi:polysaccharide pyruvyl transferase WcaK-like protein
MMVMCPMKKILVTDHYPLNKGIAAILTTALNSLQKYIPDANFTVLSYFPETTRTPFPAKVFHEILTIYPTKKPTKKLLAMGKVLLVLTTTMIWALCRRINASLADLFIKISDAEKLEILREYAEADIVVSVGGILDPSGGSTGYGALSQLYSIFLAKILLKKPVVMYAYSILEKEKAHIVYKMLANFTLNKVDLITTRDKTSIENLRKLGVTKPPIYATADPAIVLCPEKKANIEKILTREGITKEKPLIGVTVSDFFTYYSLQYHYPGSSDPYIQHKKYMRTLAQVADYVIDKLDAFVIFVPMEMNLAGFTVDDRPFIQKIVKMMEHEENFKTILGDYTPEELEGIFAQMDLLIGTRMHSLLLAAAVYTPLIAIAYESKVRAFMERINQRKWVCNLQGIDANEIRTMIDELWPVRRHVSRDIETQVKVLQTDALISAKMIAKILYRQNEI